LTCVAALAVFLGGCPFGGSGGITPALKQIPAETQVLLAKKGMTADAPILIRIFKEESQLEIWKEKPDGRFHHFKTYPICNWSGDLGPKLEEGDKQSPEGFYTVTPGQMNPNSNFHLAFNLGYPNAYDQANGRTGSALMVHGDCTSAGCYAMTDALIEEIYALGREAFHGGQQKFHVHAFPFRMTAENMKRHRKSRWYRFWKTLKVGHDDFEMTRIPPKVAVCSRQYLVNADFFGHVAKPEPNSTCPSYRRSPGEPFNPFVGGPRVSSETTGSTGSSSPDQKVASYGNPNQTPRPAPSNTKKSAEQDGAQAEKDASSALKKPAEPAEQTETNQPALAASTATAPEESDAKTEAAKNTEPGLHNVAKSGKGDMIRQ